MGNEVTEDDGKGLAPNHIAVSIRGIAVGGAGVGQVFAQHGGDDLLGITAFVPFAAPGEQVVGRLLSKKKNYVEAELVEVREAASSRREAPCAYFGHCGGCDLQHMSYESQCHAKQAMILNAMRASRLPQAVVDVLQPIVPSLPDSYRRRITLHVDRAGRIGFYRSSSRSIVEIKQCLVATPAIQEMMEKLQSIVGDICHVIRSVELSSDDRGAIAVLRVAEELAEHEVNTVMKVAKPTLRNAVLLSAGKVAASCGRTYLELPLKRASIDHYRLPAFAFSQVNWGVNQALISFVERYVRETSSADCIDLYAGAGNFSMLCAKLGKAVTAVECDETLVSFGRQNAESLKVKHRVTFKHQSVEQYLRGRPPLAGRFIIADPPRSGLGRLVPQVSGAHSLVLVSCSLPSFVRDIRSLLEHGWCVENIQPFDMFAQTAHVEIAAFCRRPDQ